MMIYARSRAKNGHLETLKMYNLEDAAHKYASKKIWFLPSYGENQREKRAKYDKWYNKALEALNSGITVVINGVLYNKDSELLKKEIEWKGYDKYEIEGTPLEVLV